MSITKTGQLITNLDDIKYLVNNFTKTGNTTGWTLASSTLANGIVTLSGASPQILSPYFSVGSKDIIAIEFTVSLPTPSTTTSGPGLYLGSPGSQGVYVHTFNHTTKTWTRSTSAKNNPYYLQSYNKVDTLIQKHYFLGAEVDLNDVPWGESSNTSYPARAIQLPAGTTVTQSRLRAGYNTNTSMVIHFSDPRIYNITQRGFYDANNITQASLGKNWVNGFQIIEY